MTDTPQAERQEQLRAGDPIMVAWNAYTKTDDYANTKHWARDQVHVDGSLWAAFVQGYTQRGEPASCSPACPVREAAQRLYDSWCWPRPAETLNVHQRALTAALAAPCGPTELPEEREADDLALFLADVRLELSRAEAAWPDGDIYLRLAALAGEVGELAQGTIKNRSVMDLRGEAVQVAVTAYRAARVLLAAERRAAPTEGEKP